MNLDDLFNKLDFFNFDYFYHKTESGIGQKILERGLLMEGTYYEDIVLSSNIVGFVDLDTKEIVMNKSVNILK